jgi:hypothetical protein
MYVRGVIFICHYLTLSSLYLSLSLSLSLSRLLVKELWGTISKTHASLATWKADFAMNLYHSTKAPNMREVSHDV